MNKLIRLEPLFE